MNSSYSTRRWNQYGWFCAYLWRRGIFSLLVVALSLGLSLAAAAPELPSTPAGKVLAGYLEALNSGNKDVLEAFIKAHRPDRSDALDPEEDEVISVMGRMGMELVGCGVLRREIYL